MREKRNHQIGEFRRKNWASVPQGSSLCFRSFCLRMGHLGHVGDERGLLLPSHAWGWAGMFTAMHIWPQRWSPLSNLLLPQPICHSDFYLSVSQVLFLTWLQTQEEKKVLNWAFPKTLRVITKSRKRVTTWPSEFAFIRLNDNSNSYIIL